jgi:hypothetical protein
MAIDNWTRENIAHFDVLEITERPLLDREGCFEWTEDDPDCTGWRCKSS